MQEEQLSRFDIKTETKVLKALSKIFKEADNPLNETEAIGKDLFLIDNANVCLIQAISTEAKLSLRRFIDRIAEPRLKSMPTLSYKALDGIAGKDRDISSLYDAEYLKLIINLMSCFDESVRIKINIEYPATFENKHFRVILAPRVNCDY